MAGPSAQHETSDAATRLAQAASRLTEDQRREVADFAEFLVDRPTTRQRRRQRKRITQNRGR